MKNKEFIGSNTHIFSMVYPWIVIVEVIFLDRLKFINVLAIPAIYVLGLAIIPVLIALLWFVIKNKKYEKI